MTPEYAGLGFKAIRRPPWFGRPTSPLEGSDFDPTCYRLNGDTGAVQHHRTKGWAFFDLDFDASRNAPLARRTEWRETKLEAMLDAIDYVVTGDADARNIGGQYGMWTKGDLVAATARGFSTTVASATPAG